MNNSQQTALLQRFEPVMRYTRGERFFPINVDEYIETCSLWAESQDSERIRLVPPGQLNVERLALTHVLSQSVFDTDDTGVSAHQSGVRHFLKYTGPLMNAQSPIQNLRHLLMEEDEENTFRAGLGRLARVGYASRFVDALFSIALLARGRVPGDAAAAATTDYQRMLNEHERYHYYGRVVRQGDWIVLQYWFFYVFNNWRSGFFGANDHEADWEMICIYLSEDETEAQPDDMDIDQFRPEWVAYASHDYHGDDLRRRWDDPEVEKVGEHPVIYVGAGSHASYFSAGEYVTELKLPFIEPLIKLVENIQRFWHNQMRQYQDASTQAGGNGASSILLVPFVDYARGDGLALGPEQEKSWDPPTLISIPPTWVTNFRGLWGLYTRDPFSGEDAPAGPMYNRDGSVRSSWYDPVGWSGLDKVPPIGQSLKIVERKLSEEQLERQRLLELADQKSQQLMGYGVEVAAIREQKDLRPLLEKRQIQIDTLSTELAQLRKQLGENENLINALTEHAERLSAGGRAPLRGHLLHAHHPASPEEIRTSRLADIWAAASIGLMLIGFVALLYFASGYIIYGALTILYLVSIIEASFRGRLESFASNVAIGLAVACALVLLYQFSYQVIIISVLLAGAYIMWENLRELWT